MFTVENQVINLVCVTLNSAEFLRLVFLEKKPCLICTKNKATECRSNKLCTSCNQGITCKKIPCYMRDSACRRFIVKKAKIFCSSTFLNSRGCEKM